MGSIHHALASHAPQFTRGRGSLYAIATLHGQPEEAGCVRRKLTKVEWQNPKQLRFVLTEGKKRQFRRMCELVGLKVVGIKRVRVGRVMHGDLYAHNILWDPDNGQALLSDFGAGTLLPMDQPVVSRALKALEVRAFGCLLEELVVHAQACDDSIGSLADVAELARQCLDARTSQRPSIDEVVRR